MRPFVENLPFLCIFLAILTGIVSAVIPRGRVCYWMTVTVAGIIAVLSAVVLQYTYGGNLSFTYSMGRFAAPYGNAIQCGPLQALLAMVFSVVLALALAIVLELISKAIIPEMPFGGQVTLVAMLPVVLISYRYGVKWGFVSGFCYALLEMALGAKTVSAAFQPGYFGDGTMIFKAILMCLLDYLLAYTMMGLGGVFRDKIKNPGTSLMCGSLVALGARYLSHILSGYLLFSGWADWFFTQDGFPAWGAKLVESLSPTALGWVYSIVYNGFYMVPELILTAIAAQLIARIPKIVVKVD